MFQQKFERNVKSVNCVMFRELIWQIIIWPATKDKEHCKGPSKGEGQIRPQLTYDQAVLLSFFDARPPTFKLPGKKKRKNVSLPQQRLNESMKSFLDD